MAKRGFKLQEFVAHASSVKCIKIGTKSCGLFLTGGEDNKVNLWAIGKHNSLLSLSGHTSAVESVTFDSDEVLVVSGASTGAIKLWDVEKAKIIRTITGHRTNCTAVEFHPFGEFFASGSLDANLKIWDIRRKGCIHTYKGHTQGISTIKFTPDGRWVVTGGEDNVVKIWDLTAGKLLNDFKFHEGQIRCIDFHPHEFLLATGSADGTVKLWDLETFELIESAGPEVTGVRSTTFHPDGRTLFCGLDESLQVFSWEPIRCHDVVDMGWSTLCDLCICEGKLFGCSYHQCNVGVWVVDILLIRPYGGGMSSRSNSPLELNYVGKKSSMLQGSSVKSSATVLTTEQLIETKNPLRVSSLKSTDSNHSAPKIIYEVPTASTMPNSGVCNSSAAKKNLMIEAHTRIGSQLSGRQVAMPPVVSRSSSTIEQVADLKKGVPTNRTIPPVTIFSRSSSERTLPSAIMDTEMESTAYEAGSLSSNPKDPHSAVDQMNLSSFVAEENRTKSGSKIRVVAEKFEKILSVDPPLTSHHNDDSGSHSSKGISSVKYVRGVAVELGKTKSLVQRWEQRERCTNNEATSTVASPLNPEALTSPLPTKGKGGSSGSDNTASVKEDVTEDLMQNHDAFISILQSRLTKLEVVRQFWERNDIKGAINAVGRLPDHSVGILFEPLMHPPFYLNLRCLSTLLLFFLFEIARKLQSQKYPPWVEGGTW